MTVDYGDVATLCLVSGRCPSAPDRIRRPRLSVWLGAHLLESGRAASQSKLDPVSLVIGEDGGCG